ncbi:MAG TPA: YihY/virulence factor BrkB family protein [Polyangiales bacterium]|nr:YihY/virulence factor BrkB family protein [Polyangiales bacterium]
MKVPTIVSVLKETATDWSRDNATRLAAALAFYTVLSLAPLLMLAVSIAGLVFGEEAARGQIASQLTAVTGPEAGEGIQTVLANADAPKTGTLSSILSIAVLLFGASGVFGELQSSLNEVWQVQRKPGKLLSVLRQRFFSFSMVLGVAFLLLVSLLVSAVLTAVGDKLTHALPGGEVLWQGVNLVASLGIITVIFALIFKVIPDVQIAWSDVWVGAFATAVLFTVGKFGLDMYLGRASVASPYGAAGSLIVLVIWVYYAAQILFFGAEFTQVHARRRGAELKPKKHAEAKQLERVVHEHGERKVVDISPPRTATAH